MAVSLLPIAGLFSSKLRKGLRGRKNWRNQLKAARQNGDQLLAWFHCASLGEFEQGRPLIEAYRQRYPEHFILLTFFSPSGYEIRKDYAEADLVMYLPFDTQQNARDFIALSKPAIAFFVKYEFWYNYLHELKAQGVPAISISTILRRDHAALDWYGEIPRQAIQCFTHFFTQNEETIETLKALGIRSVTLAGDTRFDRVSAIAEAQEPNAIAASFTDGSLTLIAGSVWKQDLDVLLPAWESIQNLKLIIAPHEIREEEITALVDRYGDEAVRITQVKDGEDLSKKRLLIVDTIGQLSSLYRYADIAYIGGAFGKGLHNILEAATFGMPICFGNQNYRKFAEAIDLIDRRVAHVIADQSEMQQVLQQLVADTALREEQSKASAEYVAAKRGATLVIMEGIKKWL